MDAVIKDKWVAALRGGEYEQGQRVLHNEEEDTFCCLGVLCDLAAGEGLSLNVSNMEALVDPFSNGRQRAVVTVYDDAYSTLPQSVQKWAGVNECGDFVGPDGAMDSLTRLNDSGVTFGAIADYIEECL